MMRLFSFVVAIFLASVGTNAIEVQMTRSKKALRNSQALVAAEGMELSEVQMTRSKTALRNSQALVAAVSSVTVQKVTEAFVCGMLTFEIAGGLFEISASLSLKVELTIASHKIASAVIKGGIGGGFTVGPPKIFAGALMALREIHVEAVPPKSLQAETTSAWAIAKWTVLRAFNRERKASPAAKLAQISDAKMTKIMEAIDAVPKNLKDKNFYMTDTDPKTLEVVAITDPTDKKFIAAVQKDMQKQWLDSLVLLATNLKEKIKAACAGNNIPTQDKYKEAVQAAYWKTYVSESATFDPKPKSGLFGTGSPGCPKVHTQVPSSVTNDHKPGFHNVLCVVMTHAMLIEGRTEVESGLTKGKQGYKNTIDMINILFDEVLKEPVDKIYGAAANAAKNSNTDHSVDVFVDDLHLGKTKAAYQARTAFRILGDILVDDNSKTRDKRLKAFGASYSIQEQVNRCDMQQPVDPECGFQTYTLEDTMSATLGWGGGINFCTPDTNLLQTHIMRKRTYMKGSGTPTVPQEKTMKLILAGSIYFQAEFNFELENKYYLPKVTSKGLTSALVRIQVPTQTPLNEHCCEDSNPGTAAAFEEFFVKNAETLATAVLSIFGVGAEIKGHLDTEEKKKFTTARDQFVDNIKTSPKPRAAKVSFRSLMTVTEEKDEWPIAGVITAVGISATYGMMRGAINAGAMSHFLPASVYKVQLIGGEVELHRSDNKWKGVSGGPIYMKYYAAEASTAPWGALVGLGFDVKAGGYAGFTTKLQCTWK